MLAAICAAMCSLVAEVPPDADVRTVSKYIAELTKNDLAKLKQKKTTKEQYADALVGYAIDEKKPAAKFALFKEAFKAYADAKSYEKADGVYSSAQAEGGTEYALAVVGTTTLSGAAKELKARIEDDKKSYRQIGILKSKLKKSPGDEALCESLGLEYAAVGNWEGALAAFLTAPGEVAKVADWELNKGNAYTAAKAAEFWWGYADGKPKAKMEAVRLHAAMWYEMALGENAYSGNETKIVQGRIDETKSYEGAAMQDKATLDKQVKELKPIVLPLKGKTVIEFVGVPAGEFTMGIDNPRWNESHTERKAHKVIISRQFWISKYTVTKDVWEAYTNKKIDISNYDKVMGNMRVPQIMSYIEAIDFCEWLTKKYRGKLPVGYIVRLPTEAEWEYAFKVKDSEKGSLYYDWEKNSDQISVQVREIRSRAKSMKLDIGSISDSELYPIEVGTKAPNGLGLYDMLGNGYQLMLDTVEKYSVKSRNLYQEAHGQTAFVYQNEEKDPFRFCKEVAARYCLTRGSSWNTHSPDLYGKRLCSPDSKEENCQKICLRLCIGPDLMKEKGYSFKHPKK